MLAEIRHLTSHIPHRPLGRLWVFALAFALIAQVALGTPYEVLYDANVDGVFPEDEGWVRITTDGGAIRTVEDGLLKLDGFASNMISDQYRWNAMETLDPDPGELFYAEWRMRLLPESDNSDVGVAIFADGMLRDVAILYTVFSVRNTGDGRRLDLDTTVFHTYRLESLDMVDYTMFVDGLPVWTGFFALGSTQSSFVRFGDGFVGTSSGSEWDYFHFGVVPIPEPSSILLVLGGCLFVLRRRTGTPASYTEDRSCPGSSRLWRCCWSRPPDPLPESSSSN